VPNEGESDQTKAAKRDGAMTKRSKGSAEGNSNAIRLDAAAQGLIGSQLKEMYAKLCGEPVPPHLLDLLRKLERKEKEGE
jgi:hypothetical protein